MSKLETNTIDNISGSSTLTIGDSNASTISIPKNITLGASGTTITVPAGATITNNGTQTGFGGTNTPAFEAYLSSNQSISSSSATKVQFNTEVLDTDGCYDNSTNYRFTPTVAGNYLINVMLGCNGGGGSTLTSSYAHIYKNGSLYIENHLNVQNTSIFYHTPVTSAIINFNGSTDYVEAYGTITTSGSPSFQSGTYSRFWGFKIIE